MLIKAALAVGVAQDRLAARHRAVKGTWAGAFWALAWAPTRLLFLWLMDLVCLKHRKDPQCRD